MYKTISEKVNNSDLKQLTSEALTNVLNDQTELEAKAIETIQRNFGFCEDKAKSLIHEAKVKHDLQFFSEPKEEVEIVLKKPSGKTKTVKGFIHAPTHKLDLNGIEDHSKHRTIIADVLSTVCKAIGMFEHIAAKPANYIQMQQKTLDKLLKLKSFVLIRKPDEEYKDFIYAVMGLIIQVKEGMLEDHIFLSHEPIEVVDDDEIH